MIKNFTRLVITGTFAMTIACTDQEMTAQKNETNKLNGDVDSSQPITPNNNNPFNKTTGAPIEADKAQQWIDNYQAANPQCEKNYVVKSNALKTILNTKKCVGISFFYAFDGYKMIHVLPIGIDEKGKQIQSKYVTTQRGDITWKTAQQWISCYTGATKSHFFGQNTFSRLWTDGVADISISFARDDNSNAQLLLRTKTGAGTNGKGSAQNKYEDASAACPPACPK